MRNIHYLILCFFLSLTPNFVNASKIDSLKQLLQNAEEKEKPEIYNNLSSNGNPDNPKDSTFYFAKKALSIAIKNKIEYQEGLAYKNLGRYFLSKSKLDTAIINFKQAVPIFERIDSFKKLIYTYHDLAHVYSNLSDYKISIDYLLKALAISEKNNFFKGIVDIKNGLGIVYRAIGEHDKALQQYKEALNIEKQSLNPDLKAMSKINSNIGLILWDKKEYDKALPYFQDDLEFQQKMENDRGLMTAHTFLGMVYGAKENHNLSLSHYRKALTYAEKINSEYLTCIAYLNIGDQLVFTNRNKEALIELNKALILAKKLDLIDLISNTYNHMFMCYENLGDYKNALKYFKKHSELKDSISINDSKTKIAELETKYETEKKEEQIEVLNQENEIQKLKLDKNRNNMVLMIISICILLASGIFYFLYLRQKQKSKEIIKKYNYDKQLLSSIISTEDKERKRFASDLHDGLGPLLSSVKLYLSGIRDADETEKPEMVNYATELIDESIKSVRIISNNILPAELSEYGLVPSINRFTKKIQYSKQIEFSIKDETNEMRFDSSTELILYRVIQELINNSIKHSEADMINIKFAEEKKVLDIFYSDNGKGFDIAGQRSNAQGIGLKNIYERIGSLNGNLEIKSSEGQGMQVDIRIKI